VVTMYSTPWCGYCRRLKSQMEREGIAYTEVDIEQDPGAADYVMSVNGGNQTVPTVRFHDGSALTNPTIVQVKERLAALPPPAPVEHQPPHRVPLLRWLRRRRTPAKP
jgi:mycoredoxin